jgi:hypothetical protein
LGDL